MYDTSLWLSGKEFKSRLIVGTGKYPSFENMREAIEASGSEIVTVAVRRVSLPGQGESLLDYVDPKRYTLLPNTAGCYTADEAVRTCYLAREAGLGTLVKLEVIGDSRTLFPDAIGLLEATRTLAREGFTVLPYTNDDPVMAKKLEDAGAAAVMPLGAPIGSGLGIRNPYNIKLILEAVTVPVIVDAGVGHRVGRGHRHGAGLRRRADEHRHRGGQGPGGDGHRDEAGRRGGPARLQGGAHRQEALRHRVLSSRGRARVDQLGFRLYLITDRAASARPPVDVVEECLAAGLRAVQLREKDLEARRAARDGARAARGHAGPRRPPPDQRSRGRGPRGGRRRGAAHAHLAAGRSARGPSPRPASSSAPPPTRWPRRDGPSPTAPTSSSSAPSTTRRPSAPTGHRQGLPALEQVAGALTRPVIAVGGLTPARVPEVLAAGAAGVAVIRDIYAAERPGERTKAFLDALGSA